MTRKDALMLALAALFGFAGGAVFTRSDRVNAAAPRTIRATRFEVVDELGKTIAFWGLSERHEVVLAFIGMNQTALAAFGLGSDQMPFLNFTGRDGKSRVDLRTWEGRPFLRLSDERWQGRVALGFIAGDAPSPDDETWGLAFGAPLAHRTLAAIGLTKDRSSGTVNGSIVLEDARGKIWRAP